MESLESLVKQENMNKFLDETFEGIDEDYRFLLFSAIIWPSVSDGLNRAEPQKNFEISDATGTINKEQKEKIISAAKKLYSFGYCLGQEILEKAKPKEGCIELDRFSYMHNWSRDIFGSLVGYFNPAGVEEFKEEIAADFSSMISDALSSGEITKKVN